MFKYVVISGPNTEKYGPKITPYLGTFHAVIVSPFSDISIMEIGHFENLSVTPLKVPIIRAQKNKKDQKPWSRFFKLKTAKNMQHIRGVGRTQSIKVACVVNSKLVFTDLFFYNLVVLINLCKIR